MIEPLAIASALSVSIAAPALLALGLDAVLGWPARLYRWVGHPVGAFARFLTCAERVGNPPQTSFAARRLAGIAAMVALIALTWGAAWMLDVAAAAWLGAQAWILTGLLAWPALAQRSLYTHVRAVAEALERDNLAEARHAVGQICGRDTANLDSHGVARAAIESLSESLSDGVIAPLFWFLIGGLPALWAYKAINTADSMIGHKDDRYAAFGWAAARLDDVANLIPARLSAVMLCLTAGRGWRVMRRDAYRHASPNSGWPEAAMAGALDLRLAGPTTYDGERLEKPWIGSGRTEATDQDIRAALRLYVHSLALLWAMIAATLILGMLIWPR